MYIQIIVMLICIIMSAYFSATETAFSSFNRTRIKSLAENGSKRAKLVLRLSDNYDGLISSILIGNNIVNIAVASIGTLLFVSAYGDIGATISTVVVTIVVLIFGEISPKSLAKDSPEQFALFSAPIINFLMKILMPISFLFSEWKKLLTKIFRVKNDRRMSQEELLMLVEEVEEDGSIDKDEGELLRSAIEFGDLEAEDILTHRIDIEAVPVETDKKEIAKIFSRSRFSRLPIYEDTIDNIIGILHQKDLYVNGEITEKPLRSIITEPVFARRNDKINDLLTVLQKNKAHVAVVLDEYGGTYGIVTMEDILEELVGDIWDEHDEISENFIEKEDGSVLVDCSVSAEEFCDYFGVSSDSDCVSLGGLVSEMLGKIPETGDRFIFENLDILVIKTENRRAVQVEVKEISKDQEASETD